MTGTSCHALVINASAAAAEHHVKHKQKTRRNDAKEFFIHSVGFGGNDLKFVPFESVHGFYDNKYNGPKI
jgi:hypothetical protein